MLTARIAACAVWLFDFNALGAQRTTQCVPGRAPIANRSRVVTRGTWTLYPHVREVLKKKYSLRLGQWLGQGRFGTVYSVASKGGLASSRDRSPRYAATKRPCQRNFGRWNVTVPACTRALRGRRGSRTARVAGADRALRAMLMPHGVIFDWLAALEKG